MRIFPRRFTLVALPVLAAILGLAVACAAPTPTPVPTPTPIPPSSSTKAADLRSTLNLLLAEHVVLGTNASAAAFGGRDAEFKAAATAVGGNSVDLSKAIGSVYGADAEIAFLALWKTHIGFIGDYRTGVITKDKAKQDKAVADLLGYADTFGAFINSASPSLPKDAVAGLVKTHILTFKEIIDAQAANDPVRAATGLRLAYGHMHVIGDALAEAIVKQFPAKFR